MKDTEKGIMEGPEKLFSSDHLKEGTRTFEVRRPKLEELCPRGINQERAEEVGSPESVHQCPSHCGGQVGDRPW